MRKENLTARQVQYMKPDPTKRMEIPAGPSLYLVVHPSGRKAWAIRYRWKGRPTKLTLSKPYPQLTLAAARAEAEAVLAELRQGINPAVAKAEEEQREPNSARQVAEEWLSRYVKPRTRTWPEVERM
ncbi:MAG: Arm DNA-binding domain-containing protein, partial [Acidobacteria bacterium]|nr:Arm DNA-binding domain-containing protein [Acidobacteriota bacterium]